MFEVACVYTHHVEFKNKYSWRKSEKNHFTLQVHCIYNNTIMYNMKQSGKMAHLINGMMTMQKIEDSASPLHMQPWLSQLREKRKSNDRNI